MKGSNHQVQGLLFVVACILLALVAYLAVHGSGRDRAEEAIANEVTMANESDVAEPVGDAAVAAAAPADESLNSSASTTNNDGDLESQSVNLDELGPVIVPDADCTAQVLAKAPGLNSNAGFSFSAGDRIGDLNMYVERVFPHEGFLCAKDQTCYPTQVEGSRAAFSALSLLDCSVSDLVEQRGELIYYGLKENG